MKTRGFTLIELLIAMAVIAILSAIAIPSYSAYVIRGQRAAAKAVLLQTAQAMERYYTAKSFYPDANAFTQMGLAAAPACVAVAPMDASAATYCVSGAPTPSGGYLLSATPCGSGGACPAGANLAFVDPSCNILTIDNTGTKNRVPPATQTADECWQR